MTSTVASKSAPTIFLDIDGVLIHIKRYPEPKQMMEKMATDFPEVQTYSPSGGLPRFSLKEAKIIADYFSPQAVKNLDALIEEIEKIARPRIVVSSGWKTLGEVSDLRWIFEKHGFSRYIVDKTGCLPSFDRGLEIARWLNKGGSEHRNFVILDDIDDGILERFPDNFIQTDQSELLTEEDRQEAYQILTGEKKRSSSPINLAL